VLIQRSRQLGVSIIEIMIGVSIVGILLALAAPSATAWIQNAQLRNAAESILRGVQQARIEALKRNTNVGFMLTDTASTAWRICLYDPINNVCFAAQPDLYNKSASEGSPNATAGAQTVLTVTTTALATGAGLPASVVFDPFGRLAATAPNNIVRVDVRNTTLAATVERRLVILITVGGQVRMCDPNLPLATNPQGCV
jgi:type IV fimbrial biogenesis protein FimT